MAISKYTPRHLIGGWNRPTFLTKCRKEKIESLLFAVTLFSSLTAMTTSLTAMTNGIILDISIRLALPSSTQRKEDKSMAGTRTAPVVSGASTQNTATLHCIDASGDLFTDSITSAGALSDIDIEAWVAAYQAATQASVYKVTYSTEWVGTAAVANAEALYRGSIKDGVNLLYKNYTTLKATTPRLVAPVASVMDGNLDVPIIATGLLATLIAKELVLLPGFTHESAQFTERRERSNNQRVKA